MSATKLVGILAVGGALFTSTACGPLADVAGGGAKDEACKNIETELRGIASSSPSLTGSGTEQTANEWIDAASTIRTEGQNAGGDVESAATAFASDLETVANSLKEMSSGNLSGGMPNVSQMQQHGTELGEACGYSGFRLGG
ncbi:hypothetical protein [Actinomadura sp. WMMB 499]|uniref:hypothetical protein n=1 Tax=Actinomadura sp. WMMB 499 TaxID=1219491 RepID=UPI001247ADB9|nr:hypothetical protein [Actinomadura sp. WMMB 499]QFG22836.1 hypothetical protein F7P10_18670 [Actinomadura sp. WMMB 499]